MLNNLEPLGRADLDIKLFGLGSQPIENLLKLYAFILNLLKHLIYSGRKISKNE